ncbi:MAG TPA: hypothetical protein VJ724_10225, partial [Tahibacter sp.]|nr:hypothetical protein [Tahibacter sp.]
MKRSFLWWSIAGAGLLASGGAAAQGSLELFKPAPLALRAVELDNAYAAQAKEPSSANISVVTVDAAGLADDTQALTLGVDIGGIVNLNVARTSSYRADDGSLVWQGIVTDTAMKREMTKNEIADDPMNSLILVRNGDKVTGNLRVNGQLFKIRPLKDARHVVVEVDENLMPLDHPPAAYRSILEKPVAMPQTPSAGEAISTIRVLVNYTPAAASASGDINGLITLAVAESNTGYTNSAVEINLQLAARSQVSYTETGNFTTDL